MIDLAKLYRGEAEAALDRMRAAFEAASQAFCEEINRAMAECAAALGEADEAFSAAAAGRAAGLEGQVRTALASFVGDRPPDDSGLPSAEDVKGILRPPAAMPKVADGPALDAPEGEGWRRAAE